MSDGQEYNNASEFHGDFLHSQQVAGWRAEISTFLQDCLMEVQSISELLQSAGQSLPNSHETTPPRPMEQFSPPEPPEDTAILTSSQYEAMTAARPEPVDQFAAPYRDTNDQPPTTPNPPPSNPTANAEADFDSRLANLKRMLAEKLTNSESQSESTPGQ